MTGLYSTHTHSSLPDMGHLFLYHWERTVSYTNWHKITAQVFTFITRFLQHPPPICMYIHIIFPFFESLECVFQPESLFPFNVYTQQAFLSEGIFLEIGRDSKEMQAPQKWCSTCSWYVGQASVSPVPSIITAFWSSEHKSHIVSIYCPAFNDAVSLISSLFLSLSTRRLTFS